MLRHDVDPVAGALEDRREPVLPVARLEVGELGAEDETRGIGRLRRVGSVYEDLIDVLILRAGEEVAEIGLVPHAPVVNG